MPLLGRETGATRDRARRRRTGGGPATVGENAGELAHLARARGAGVELRTIAVHRHRLGEERDDKLRHALERRDLEGPRWQTPARRAAVRPVLRPRSCRAGRPRQRQRPTGPGAREERRARRSARFAHDLQRRRCERAGRPRIAVRVAPETGAGLSQAFGHRTHLAPIFSEQGENDVGLAELRLAKTSAVSG